MPLHILGGVIYLMFKKISIVLLLLVLVAGCIGCASARSYHHNFNYKVGDTFKGMDVYNKAFKNGFMYQNLKDINGMIKDSGLFVKVNSYNYNNVPDNIYQAVKPGNFVKERSYTFFKTKMLNSDYYIFDVKVR
jgi:hypothetical protein